MGFRSCIIDVLTQPLFEQTVNLRTLSCPRAAAALATVRSARGHLRVSGCMEAR